MLTSLTFPTNSREPSLNTMGLFIVKGLTTKNLPDEILDTTLPEPFFTRTMKKLSRPNFFMSYGKLGVAFFSTSELIYPNMKVRLSLIRARPNF